MKDAEQSKKPVSSVPRATRAAAPKENFMQDASYNDQKQSTQTMPAAAQTSAAKKPIGSPVPRRTPINGKKTKQYSFGNLHNRATQIVLGVLAGLLVVTVVLAFVLPGNNTIPSSSSNNLVNADYDKDEYALDDDAFVGTILPETDDAGVNYITDTLFLGDSNTLRMLSYADVTHVSMKNCIGIESMGITDVTSLKCVQFKGYATPVTMPEAVAIMQPRRVVITFGTNNAGGMSAEKFITEYKKAVDAINKAYPYADIIIGSVFPIDKYTSYSISMKTIDQYNLALAEFAEEEGCKFLNWSETLKNKETGFCKTEYTIQDGIHISREGMQNLFKYFRTHSYVSEDTRPKPLNDIPERLGTPPGLILSDGTKVEGPYSYATPSSAPTSAQVTISAYDDTSKTAGGGTITINGQTVTSTTLELALSSTMPTVVATPAVGYQFVRWLCSEGTITNTTSPTLSGFVISSANTTGTITVTAVFRYVGSASSSSAPQSLPSVSSTPPISSTPPTSTTPPASTAPPVSTAPPASTEPPPVSTVQSTGGTESTE